MSAPTPEPAERPRLTVVRGTPTAEEVAAVTALLSRTGGAAAPVETPPLLRGSWRDPATRHRRSLPFGPGGWRAAAR